MATAVTFDLFARDHASGAFTKVGQAAQKAGRDVEGMGRKTRGLAGHFDLVSRVGPRSFGVLATGAKAAALGVAALGVAAGAAFVGFVKEADESAKISRITENAIRATGGAAKISATQVGALAMAISNKTGIDDEAIQSGANLLLTFKQVRNEVGRGNQIFNRATQAATDLSAAGFGSLDSASKMLGKALNDPLKGMTALGRAGVTFTAQQKTQIETLVKSGKTLEAQKIILKEVESQVGGAAAAAASPMQKLRTIVGNLGERLGGYLLPFVDRAASFLGRVLPAALDKAELGFRALVLAFRDGDVTSDGFVGAMERIGNVARIVHTGIRAMVLAFQDGDRTSDGFVGVMERLGIAIRKVTDFVSKHRELLLAMAKGVAVVTAAFLVFRTVMAGVNLVMAANPIGLVIVALGALVGGVVYAYKHSERFRQIVDTVWAAVRRLGAFLWATFKPTFEALGELISTRIWPALQGLWARLQAIWPTVQKVIVFVGKLAIGLGAMVLIVLGKVIPILIRLAGPIFTLVFAVIGKVIGIVAAMARAFITATRVVISVFMTMVGAIINGAARALGWVPGIGPKLKAAAAAFNRFRDNVNDALNGVKNKTVTVTARASVLMGQGLSRADAIGTSLHRAMGGPIRGPGGPRADRIPVMASNNEHMWAAHEVAGAGGHRNVETLRKMAAAGKLAGFAAGGPVRFDVPVRSMGLPQFRAGMSAVDRTATAIAGRAAQRLAGTMLGGGSVMGWQNQMAVLRRAFPGLALISGFRPGAITATGNRSYHASGRAVDIPPRMDVFNWIRGNYGARTKELIFSPAGGRQVWNGRPHMYSGVTRRDHWDHVHWAMARGGVIREPVLGVGRSGATYSFGERGPETVTPGVRAGTVINVNLTTVGALDPAATNKIRQAIRDALRSEGRPVTV